MGHILGDTGMVVDLAYNYVTVELDFVAQPSAVTNVWTSGATDYWGGAVPTSQSFMGATLPEDGLSEQQGVNYANADVPGRDEPLMTYEGASAREFTLTFQFHVATGSTDTWSGSGNFSPYTLLGVQRQVRWLDRLKSNYSGSGIKYPPPAVIVRVGDLLLARAVLTAGNVRWLGPFVPGTMAPHRAEYEATFTIQRAPVNYAGAYTSTIGTVPKMNVFLYHPEEVF